MINEKIHNYITTRSIGKGGMAEVWEAHHETFEERKVAIKILDPVLARKEQIARRFVNEAKIMAKLEHQNIVKVVDFEKRTDMLAIIMELLKGNNLSEYIKQRGKLPKEQTLKIFKQVLSAFEFAHNIGVVHRDIKPSNIFIEKGNNVKILDFGIAKLLDNDADLTNTGAQMGTAIYMSPEQVKDAKHINHLTDIYSLGVVLYYMLKGETPYDRTTLSDFDIKLKIVQDEFPELSSDPKMNKIIKKATAKNPSDRFQSSQEFASALNIQTIPDTLDNDDITVVDDGENKKIIVNSSTKNNSQDIKKLHIKAKQFLEQNWYKEAWKIYIEILEIEPNDAIAQQKINELKNVFTKQKSKNGRKNTFWTILALIVGITISILLTIVLNS